MKHHLTKCPKCSGPMKATRYDCPQCGTSVQGDFAGCVFCRLDDEDRLFALILIQTEGNMRDVERLMGISYPTVKARLARLNRALEGEVVEIKPPLEPLSADTPAGPGSKERAFILDMLQSGEISASEAAAQLRGVTKTKETKGDGNE